MEDEKSLNHLSIELRWGSPDDGWYQNYDAKFFERANQLILEAHESRLMKMVDQQLQKLCLEVLKTLDADGIFGSSEARETIVIGICDVGGDHAEEDFLGWAGAVNPPSAMKRLQQELQEAEQLFQTSREERSKLRGA